MHVSSAGPTASTRLTGLLGWPARYSLSPVMHNAAFRAADLDVVYLVLPCPPDRLAVVVEGLAAVGTIGVNVTIPHKQAAAGLCDAVSEEAQLVGVVNTLTFLEGSVHGDNTDATGLRAAWDHGGLVTAEDRVVVFGTGGAARAAAVAAGRSGAKCAVVGRRADAAAELAELVVQAGGTGSASAQLDDGVAVERLVADARVVVNATPIGMHGESLPEPFMRLQPDQIAYDLVYSPPETPFLAAARIAGARAHNGLSMLLHQAAQAWWRWMGEAPDVEEMRSALGRALTPQS